MKKVQKISDLYNSVFEEDAEVIQVPSKPDSEDPADVTDPVEKVEECGKGKTKKLKKIIKANESKLDKYKAPFKDKIFSKLTKISDIDKIYEAYKEKFIDEVSKAAFTYYKNERISEILEEDYLNTMQDIEE